MTLSERIQAVLDYSLLSIPKFSANVGFKTPQTVRELLSGNTKTLSDAVRMKLISSYPELNEQWLVTGEGEMLKGSSSAIAIDHSTAVAGSNNKVGDGSSDVTMRLIELLVEKDKQITKSQEQISKSQEQVSKSQEQIDRLLTMMEGDRGR